MLAVAVVGSNVCQLGWLAAADRVMPSGAFGAVLAAQALYAVLQIVIDSGTAYQGARLAASDELTSGRRNDLARIRLLLAAACVVVALVVSGVGSAQFLTATLPYTAALVLLAALNWWEPYGRGRIGPYAGYLFGRSAGLMVVAGTFYFVGGRFPTELAGVIECGVIVAIMVAFRLAPVRPRGLRPSRAAPWKAVFDIGFPAAISQYNFAAGTVILGLAGQNMAAAAVAVGARLLSGTWGLGGVLSSALFPRIARGRDWGESDRRAAGLALSLVTLAAIVATAAVMLAAPLLVRAFLHPGYPGGVTAVVVLMAASAATTVTLHLTSVLVACRYERLIRTAALTGALLISAGAAAATSQRGAAAVTVVVVVFLIAQVITASLLAVHSRRRTPFPAAQLRNSILLTLAVSTLGLVGGLEEEARLPAAALVLILAIVAAPSSLAAVLRIVAARLRAGGAMTVPPDVPLAPSQSAGSDARARSSEGEPAPVDADVLASPRDPGSLVEDRRRRLHPGLLTPVVAFPALWFVALGLSQIHVLSIQQPWSSTAWLVMLAVPVAFVIGGGAATAAVRSRVPLRPRAALEVSAPRRILVVLLLIGYAELAREFHSTGTLPLLSSHIDAARTSAAGGALALLTSALTVCAVIGLSVPRRLLTREALPEVAMGCLALIGFVIAGGRESVVIPVAAVVIFRTLYWRPPTVRVLLGGVLLGIGLFSLVFYLRTGQETSQAFAQELYGSVIPGTPKPLLPFVPIHFALGINDTVLARVVDYFPHGMRFGHGLYDSYALHAIIPARSLETVTEMITPPWLVSTFAGPMWADGGLPVVIAGCVLTGAVITAPYALFRRTGRLAHALPAAYLCALGLFCVYSNYMTQYKDWVVVAVVLFALGRVLEARAVPGDVRHIPTDRPLPGARLLDSRIGAPAVASVALLLLGGLVIAVADRDIRRERAVLASFVSTPRFPPALAPAVKALDVSRVPPGVLAAPLATDAAAGGPATIWSFTRAAGRLHLVALALVGNRLIPRYSDDLGPAPTGPGASYAVAEWGGPSVEVAFEVRAAGSRLAVTVFAPFGQRRPFSARFLSAPVPPVPGTVRQVAVVNRIGQAPDLVVLDRGAAGRPSRLRVYTGASRFQALALDESLPRRYPPPAFAAALGAVNTAGADLVFVSRIRDTRTHHMEVHVLLGQRNFKAFYEQAPIGLTARASVSLRLLVTHIGGVPALYGIDPRGSRVLRLSLAPAMATASASGAGTR